MPEELNEEIVDETVVDENIEDVVDEVIDEVDDETTQTEDPAEAEARLQGWAPEEEWNGDPKRWKSAEEFLETGKEYAAVARERNKKLTSDMAKLRADMANMIKYQSKQTDLAVKRALKDVEALRDEAIEIGDKEAVHAHDKEIEEIKKEALEKEAKGPSEVFLEWSESSDWYGTNEFLTAEADNGLVNPQSFKTERAFYEALDKKVRALYPNEFDEAPKVNPRKLKQSPVATPKKTATKSKKRTFADVPAEDKRAYETMKATIGDDFTTDDFMSQYEFDD